MSTLMWRGPDKQGEELIVRRAERRDAPRFLAHMSAIVGETDRLLQSSEDPLPELTTQRAIIEHFDRLGNCLFLVAHRPGRVVGRAEIIGSLTLLGGTTRRTRHVTRLGMGVRQAQWGRGIGRSLVEVALRWAGQAKDVERVALQVYASNEAAIKLYESTGFQRDGRLEREVRLDGGLEDLITMSRSAEEAPS
jgi:RimJ/RimL family protein N-acetyltransferase